MNKPRLVKREEINGRKATIVPAPAKPSLPHIKKAVQERKQISAAAGANARAAFAALFIPA